jgi:hypothetical protein
MMVALALMLDGPAAIAILIRADLEYGDLVFCPSSWCAEKVEEPKESYRYYQSSHTVLLKFNISQQLQIRLARKKRGDP